MVKGVNNFVYMILSQNILGILLGDSIEKYPTVCPQFRNGVVHRYYNYKQIRADLSRLYS